MLRPGPLGFVLQYLRQATGNISLRQPGPDSCIHFIVSIFGTGPLRAQVSE